MVELGKIKHSEIESQTELSNHNVTLVIDNLLIEVSASKLLASNMNYAVFTVTYEYRCFAWSNHHRGILALIHHHLEDKVMI